MCRAAADCELPLAANPPYMHAYRARPRAFEPARAKYGALPSRVSDNERRIATRITTPFHPRGPGRAHGVPGPRTPVHAAMARPVAGHVHEHNGRSAAKQF